MYDKNLKTWVGQKYCGKCPALVISRKQVTSGYGNLMSKIMFLGEAPGQSGCNLTGVPFTKDRSGMLFQRFLEKAGFAFKDVYTTNICKCSPPYNRNPNEIEILNCSDYLKKEIRIVKPKVIVALGRVACKFILQHDDFSVFYNCGDIYPVMHDFFNGDVIVMPHPAAILRNMNKCGEYEKAWKFIKKIADEAKTVQTEITDKGWKKK